MVSRSYSKMYFAQSDTRVFQFRQKWDALISGAIPYESWRKKPFDRRIVETIALDAFEAAGPEESSRLLKFLRTSGLIEKRIFEARHHRGWRRKRALVALGRTRAPEGIAALAEGLRDRDAETRLAALRGLGRVACPEAGREILIWVGEVGLAESPSDRKSTRLNSSHVAISYAVFCLKKKNNVAPDDSHSFSLSDSFV